MTDANASEERQWKTQVWYASNRQTGPSLMERINHALMEIRDLGGEVIDVQHTYAATAPTRGGTLGNVIFVMVVYQLPVDVVYRPPTDVSPPDQLFDEAR
jgi:hypothetical protein